MVLLVQGFYVSGRFLFGLGKLTGELLDCRARLGYLHRQLEWFVLLLQDLLVGLGQLSHQIVEVLPQLSHSPFCLLLSPHYHRCFFLHLLQLCLKSPYILILVLKHKFHRCDFLPQRCLLLKIPIFLNNDLLTQLIDLLSLVTDCLLLLLDNRLLLAQWLS